MRQFYSRLKNKFFSTKSVSLTKTKKRVNDSASKKVFTIGGSHPLSKEVINRITLHKKLDSLIKQDVVRRVTRGGKIIYIEGDNYKLFLKNAKKKRVRKKKKNIN